ncbi:hypothetical protein L1049_020829 [Liquidambar formosana]|uniref:Uncharacterized protein n=1 Tax=Liquidambar formosana TaxID=63359 RepID=A0AAP0SEI4_LIQFO
MEERKRNPPPSLADCSRYLESYWDKDADLAISRANGAWCCNRRILVKRAAFRNPTSSHRPSKFSK